MTSVATFPKCVFVCVEVLRLTSNLLLMIYDLTVMLGIQEQHINFSATYKKQGVIDKS
jgi:hypothetical protein